MTRNEQRQRQQIEEELQSPVFVTLDLKSLDLLKTLAREIKMDIQTASLGSPTPLRLTTFRDVVDLCDFVIRCHAGRE